MSKLPTYLHEPHSTLPGIFIDIPVNRKARRIENRKNRQNRVKQRFIVTARPLVLTPSGYYRTKATDMIWREGRRDLIRSMRHRAKKETK